MTPTDQPSKSLDETFRSYAWDYFALHADQRMKAFHFYILLSTAILGGFAVLLRNGAFQRWMAVFGLFLIFFSFVFWKLDNRTRGLIKHGEEALEYLDSEHKFQDIDGVPHPLAVFSREKALSAKLPLYPLVSAHFTYARCFRWVFTMFSIVGVGAIVTCLVFAPA
ncbi:MAG: hypothetical protein V4451_02380 [Pseudomonadota bacterium]